MYNIEIGLEFPLWILLKRGRKEASVLPLPVGAIIKVSFPVLIIGIAFAWIGVNSLNLEKKYLFNSSQSIDLFDGKSI